jgi:hypothetical protein
VADHPLRPATDHRLGGPLPHQLANPTRAPPAAINLSPKLPSGACGISRSFPRLSPTTGQVPTRYSPVRHSPGTEAPGAFDLHVLGMPPAFVLSQDQTLKFIPDLLKSRHLLKGRPDQGPPNVRIDARTPSDPTPPSAHPFPLLHNLKQHAPPALRPQRPNHRGAALIGPPHPRVNTRSRASITATANAKKAQQRPNVIPPTRPVQSGSNKNLPHRASDQA